MKPTGLYCLVTAAFAVATLNFVDGEDSEQHDCMLSRVCRNCTCHINKRLRRNFCPATPRTLLDSVHIIGGLQGCLSLSLSNGLLSSFQTKFLKLQFVGIRFLSNNTFRDQPFLEELNLRNNKIETIEVGTFQDLPRLRSLDLTSNWLTEFPLLALSMATNLTSLHLSRNRLTRLDATIVDQRTNKLNSLETLRMSYNKIRTMSVEVFNMFPRLSELSLHGNQLNCDCQLAWLREFLNCTCAMTRGPSCVQPSNMTSYNVLDFPIRHCPPGQTLANCAAPRNCVFVTARPARTRPVMGKWEIPGNWDNFVIPASAKIDLTTVTINPTTSTTKSTTATTQGKPSAVSSGQSRIESSLLLTGLSVIAMSFRRSLQQWMTT